MNETTPDAKIENNFNQSVQKQINLMLGALIILAGTLAAFFYIQARHLRQDLKSIRPVASMVIQAYSNDKPHVDAFVAKLAEYGRSHSNFAPIMKKYQLDQVTNAAPATIPTTKPGTTSTPPAKAPAPKK